MTLLVTRDAQCAVLPWGRHYLTVSPDHFRIDYCINPYMDPDRQPDAQRAREQWERLRAALTDAGARVDVLPQLPGAPDMVYAMNLAQPWTVRGERHVLASHMRYPQRRMETPAALDWFAAQGWQVHTLGRMLPSGDQVDAWGRPAPHFEAGDLFGWRGDLLIGHGPRTELGALPRIGSLLGRTVHPVRITHPAMFHLDLSFAPLTDTCALVCPEAWDADSAGRVLELVPDPIVISAEEALAFAANCVAVGDVVIGAGLNPRLIDELTERGLRVADVDLDAFHLAGGSARCMTAPLDLDLS